MSNPLFNGGAPGNGMPNKNAIMQSIASDLNYLRRFQSPAQFWAALERVTKREKKKKKKQALEVMKP